MAKLMIAIIFGVLISACASAPRSSIGLYGPKPVAQDIKGSSAQYSETRTVNFTRQEVFEATNTALLRLG